jgi:gamma-glutamyl:cysteine ligase YbdK (ATP-grasp superfamily)
MADLVSGEPAPTRERLRGLLDAVAPTAARLGCAAELAAAGALVDRNGALRQREVVAEAGLAALVPWLSARFTSRRPAVTADRPRVAEPL